MKQLLTVRNIFSLILFSALLYFSMMYFYFMSSSQSSVICKFHFYPRNRPLKPVIGSFSQRLNSALLNANRKTYKILLWYPPFGSRVNYHIDSEKCGKCEIIYNRKKIYHPNTKAVVFHFRECNISSMPLKSRRKDQLYVWWCLETPHSVKELTGLPLFEYNNVFNLTMTYRRDADIYFPYATLESIWESTHTQEPSGLIGFHRDQEDLLQRKNKLALWIVSNCDMTKDAVTRMDYSDQLIRAGLRLDRKGGCFPLNGPADRDQISQYKFYMAFENTFHCKDYITEKLFYNSFKFGTVPVVYGAMKSDYKAIVPPHSVIYAEDYETPEDLVRYLNYLDQNPKAYLKYFKWRTMFRKDMPNFGRQTSFCQLCRVLHGINVDNIYRNKSKSFVPLFGFPNKSRIVPSIEDWFIGTENKDCFQYY